MRCSQEEIKKYKKELGVTKQASWSKIKNFREDPYSYLLHYILGVKQDNPQNAYSSYGGQVHDLLEKFYDEKIDKKKMIDEFDNIMIAEQLKGYKFNADDDKNKNIIVDYTENVKHYLYNCEKEWCGYLETFGYAKVGDYFLYGYIDKTHMDEHLIITDYKTSTKYSVKKAEEEKGQLLLYALFYNKTSKIPSDGIDACWDFIKYCNVTFKQMNGEYKTQSVKRTELVDKMTPRVKSWLKKEKYSDEDIKKYIDLIKESHLKYNDEHCFEQLPENVRDKFSVSKCIVNIKITQDILDKFEQELIETLDEIDKKTEAYKLTKDEKIFWTEINSGNLFFFTNLCGYSPKLHKPLKEYLDVYGTSNNEKDKDISDEAMKLLFGKEG